MVSLVGVRLVHVKNELAKDGWVKGKRVSALDPGENGCLTAIKSYVCTQREKSCASACAFVCVCARACERAYPCPCVHEGAVRCATGSASLYVRQRTRAEKTRSAPLSTAPFCPDRTPPTGHPASEQEKSKRKLSFPMQAEICGQAPKTTERRGKRERERKKRSEPVEWPRNKQTPQNKVV